MKILIATPLFPPDIAAPAPYVKELAQRFSKEHEVILAIYGYLPEKIPGVVFECVDKRQLLIIRLFQYFVTLLKEVRNVDILYAENGASVELPLGLVAFLTKKPLILHIGDKQAHEQANKTLIRSLIERFVRSQSSFILEETPQEKPEILPFKPYPKEAFEVYEQSWKTHLDDLNEKIQLCLR